jgi:hypothetical protein
MVCSNYMFKPIHLPTWLAAIAVLSESYSEADEELVHPPLEQA